MNQSSSKSLIVEIQFGARKGKKLTYPSMPGLRPTLARSRDVLFNWLGLNCQHKNVLDLFAGTGILGIQALCLGAERVDFVDTNSTLLKVLEEHLVQMQWISKSSLSLQDSLSFLKKAQEETKKYDLIFLDPPFDQPALFFSVLSQLSSILSQEGVVFLESPSHLFHEHVELLKDFFVEKSKKIGQVQIYLLKKRLT